MTTATTTPRPLRDGAYVGLGLTVLAVQQAAEVLAQIDERAGFARLREQAEKTRERVNEALAPVAERAQKGFERLIERLPEQAQETWGDARKLGEATVAEVEKFLRRIADVNDQPETVPGTGTKVGTATVATPKPTARKSA